MENRMSRRWLAAVLACVCLGGTAALAQAQGLGPGYPSPYTQPGFNLPAPPPAPTDLVKTLLTSLNPRHRLDAAQALGATGDVQAIQPLATAAVYDQNSRVRQAASDSLALIRRTAGGGLSVKPPPPAWGALPGAGAPGFDLPPPPPAAPDPAVELVLSWYQRYLRRSCDPSGLMNWVDLLRRGASAEQVQASILGSPEYFALHGYSTLGFINGLYNDVLGRNPTIGESQYWAARLGQIRGNRERAAFEYLGAAQGELHSRPGIGYYQGP